MKNQKILEGNAGYDLLIDYLNTSSRNAQVGLAYKHGYVGTILSVADGVARVDGLKNVGFLQSVTIKTISGSEITGLIMDLHADTASVVIFGSVNAVQQGDLVYCTGKPFSVPVGASLTGRVVNALGQPIDGDGSLSIDQEISTRQVEVIAPGIIERQPVNSPVQTGIKVIDSMFPIGQGQRELIIGDRETGKTAVCIDTIINQKRIHEVQDTPMFCIYVAIGQKESTVAELHRVLKLYGAMGYTTIVSSPAWEAVGMRYISAYSACTMGEHIRNNGGSCLIIYDDLSQHAISYREMALILRRPPGREAYPGDVFYLHSRLLERSAKMSNAYDGGSLTALPVVETQEGEVSAYIPTNVISITDGQIYLETTLFHQGIKPAINTGLSVSRVGSAAQVKQMKQLCKSLKVELANFREVMDFAHFSDELDDATKKFLERGKRLVELLKQPQYTPLSIPNTVLMIFIGLSGCLDSLQLENITKFEKLFLEYASTSPLLQPSFLTLSRTMDESLAFSAIEYFKGISTL